MTNLHPRGKTDLSSYDNSGYRPGRGPLWRGAWYVVNAIFFLNPLNPFSALKRSLLILFGARIGHGVVLKPSLNIKYPWNLTVGDHVWIGERAWLDSLAPITIGSHVCISQEAYLCTGSHDSGDSSFPPQIEPIIIEDGAWIGARATVLGGVTVGSHAVLAAGAVIARDARPYMIYSGNPALIVAERTIRTGPADE